MSTHLPSYNKVYKRVSGDIRKSKNREFMQQLGMTALGAIPWIMQYRRQGQFRDEDIARQEKQRQEDYDRSTIPVDMGAPSGPIGPSQTGEPMGGGGMQRVTPQQLQALAALASMKRAAATPSWQEQQDIEHQNRMSEIRAADEWRNRGAGAPVANVPADFQGILGPSIPVNSDTNGIITEMMKSQRGVVRPETEAQINQMRREQLTHDPKYWLSMDTQRLQALGVDPEGPIPKDIPLGAGQYMLPEEISKDTAMLRASRDHQMQIEAENQRARETSKRSILGDIIQATGMWRPVVGEEGTPDLMRAAWNFFGGKDSAIPPEGGHIPSEIHHATKPRDEKFMQSYQAVRAQNPAGLPNWLAEMKAQGYDVSGL